MKNNLSIILAAGAAGVALIKLSSASFLASVSGEVVMSTVAGLAVLGIAISDYARRPRPLSVRASIARPAIALPVRQSTAYSVRRCPAIVERAA